MTPEPEPSSAKPLLTSAKPQEPRSTRHEDLVELLSRKVVGQPTAMQYIVPYIQMHQAGLSPEGRPVGIFLLLGPTGTGKTRTVEALAEVLHDNDKKVLKIDCGEFQTDHEVAKLIGAPPGYLGHRETQPVLTQEKLQGVTSSDCPLSLVLFDEIEKAAPALSTLLLGILDRATLTLGDNSVVNFEQSLIFLTSNLGAREMMKEMTPTLGFQGTTNRSANELAGKLESIGLAAIRKRFSPEFVNRLDVVVTYQPLDSDALSQILSQHIHDLQQHVNTRLGSRSFEIDVSTDARGFLLEKGTSTEYGARELKRTIHRNLTQPLAGMVATGAIEPGAQVTVGWTKGEEGLTIKASKGQAAPMPKEPVVLVVDDNQGLLAWLEQELKAAGVKPAIAASLEDANKILGKTRPDAALVDVMLPDGNGVHLAVHLRKQFGKLPVIVMSGMVLQAEEAAICQSYNFQTLYKPFLAQDVRNMLQALLLHGSAERAKSAGQSQKNGV